MNTSRKNIGHIHRVREFELEKVSLADEFDILQIVGEGWFGKILLVEHRATDTEMVLKALPKPYVALRDFYREFHYSLHLGIHKNIVTTYDVAFETAGFYVFTQEYAPLGDLTSNVLDTGIGEIHTKKVAKQIASALDYMHSKDLVHRDVKLDNVLVFKSDFSRVKLCDFGESRRINTTVQRRNEWLAYSPPEVLSVRTDDTYKTDPSHDIWQFAIVLFVCLTGCLPWQKAASDDPRYVRYYSWHNASLTFPIKRQPKLFKLVSSRASKMFRKFLEPRQDRRPTNLSELHKYLDDRWLAKGAEKDLAANEPDELCPSMYSFHSSPEEKNKLLADLAQCGIETTVDRVAKKARIRDWIQSSIITEEDEEDDSGTTTPSSTMSRTPIAGHVSSVRAEEQKQINTTIKDASKKHMDPRTGQVQNGPSEMGPTVVPTTSNNSPDIVTDNQPISTQKVRNESYQNQNGTNIKTQKVTESTQTTPNRFPNDNTDRRMSSASTGSTIQTMVNARLEIPMKGPNKNIRTINETYNYSSRTKQESSNNVTRKNSPQKSTSQGLMSAFKSVATISVPEVDNFNSSNKGNTKIDSGYGSTEKIRNNSQNPTIRSPILLKRSFIKSDSSSLLLNNSSSSKDASPFDSDDVESPRGSTGFVNLVGNSTTMKDTPYDHVMRSKKK